MYLSALSCVSFRNYKTMALTDLPTGLIGLTGDNGAGKTNILEAISLLTPGRGLRGARDEDLQHKTAPLSASPWGLHARIEGKYGPQNLGIGLDPVKGRRMVHLNGEKMKSVQDRADLFRCIWMTPAQDRLFLEGGSARRKFLDRWVFSADPAHAGRITRLDRLLAERNRLLCLDRVDPLWLDALESDLAQTALAVATARTDYLDRLRPEISAGQSTPFPTPLVQVRGFLEERIGREPALTIEEDYRATLKRNRARDKAALATTTGPHRSDLFVVYADKNMPAGECSTGEQKALLFSLFMAHVRLVARETGDVPVLLLDEITAHLDPDRRAFLLGHLLDLGAQVFMSATTDDQFSEAKTSVLYHVHDSTITRAADSSPSDKAA